MTRRNYSNGEFGEYVRKARRQSKLTLSELAGAADISESFLSRVENGVLIPRDSKVRRLAEALGADPTKWLRDARVARVSRGMQPSILGESWRHRIRDLLMEEAPRTGDDPEVLVKTLESELAAGLKHGNFEFHI